MPALTLLGGPTVVLDLGGLRLVTDPTFDPPGSYPVGERTLTKTQPSAWTPDDLGPVDAVLLSHDQHPDNLDRAGRLLLAGVPVVLTTEAAAGRLGGTTRGLAPWARFELARHDGRALRVTAVPAQHGPDDTEHLTGPVTGFVLSGHDVPTTYVSGDNASLGIVEQVAARFAGIDLAVIFAGGARTALLGEAYLTLTSAGAARAVRLLGGPRTVVVHTDGWSHFTEPADTLPAAFEAEGLAHLLERVTPGRTVRW